MKRINLDPFKKNKKHLILRHFLNSFPRGGSGAYKKRARALFYNGDELLSTLSEGKQFNKCLANYEFIGIYTAPELLANRSNFYEDIQITIEGDQHAISR